MMNTQMAEAVDQAMAGSGKSAFNKDTPAGTTFSGPITKVAFIQVNDYKTKQPAYFPSGDPKMRFAITIDAGVEDFPDDDGARTIYINAWGDKRELLKQAITDAGYVKASEALAPGNIFTATFDGKRMMNGNSGSYQENMFTYKITRGVQQAQAIDQAMSAPTYQQPVQQQAPQQQWTQPAQPQTWQQPAQQAPQQQWTQPAQPQTWQQPAQQAPQQQWTQPAQPQTWQQPAQQAPQQQWAQPAQPQTWQQPAQQAQAQQQPPQQAAQQAQAQQQPPQQAAQQPTQQPASQGDQIQQLIRQGQTDQQISTQTGIDPATIAIIRQQTGAQH